MSPLHERFSAALPRLTAANYRETSPISWVYNCVAWAAGVDDAWWWPTVGRYWPPGVARDETLTAFIAAFATIGFLPDHTATLQPDTDKVALYADVDKPTHAARQLLNGWWTSKLGPSVDIEHELPESVAGGLYGEVVVILSRKRTV